MRDSRLSAARLTTASTHPAEPGNSAPPAVPPLVAIAHGSKDPRAAATVNDLLAVVRAGLPGGLTGGGLSAVPDVRAAFLDHCAPSLAQALAALAPDDADPCASVPAPGGRYACVAVPLLLTAAYHSKSDIPAQLAAATAGLPRLDVECAATLGPHPLLLAALERRLREAGIPVDDPAARAQTSVVLAAAGSSDPAANDTIATLAGSWGATRGWQAIMPAYASATGPRPEEAVAALRAAAPGGGPVVVATYLLAPGYFADKIHSAALAAGATAVSGVLGAAPEVAAVILERYLEAISAAADSDADLAQARG